MAENLKGRNFLTLLDSTPKEIHYLIGLAATLKAQKRAEIYGDTLKRKNIALIFEKPSTRTRCAFIGLAGLGFNELFLWVFTSLMGWYYLLSKLAATPLIFLWNFFARRFTLFSAHGEIVATAKEGE